MGKCSECNKNKKIAFVKHQLNFNSKSTTAGSVHLMESLLDTVDIIHLPSQAACIWDFLRVLVSKLISNLPALINTGAKTLHFLFWHQKY